MSHREFDDGAGTRWTVWDVHPLLAERLPAAAGAADDGSGGQQTAVRRARGAQRTAIDYVDAGLAAGWLCFESEAGKRRLAPIPMGWEELPPDSLTSLCERATPVAPTRRRHA